MNQRTLLKRNIALAKTGNKEAFENLYILTAPETYAKAFYALGNKKDAEALLVDTYVMLYRHIHELPDTEEGVDDKISDIMLWVLRKKLGIDIHDLYSDPDRYWISEDRAATLWLWIEEKAGYNKQGRKRETVSKLTLLSNTGKILLSAVMVLLTIFVIYKGIGWINGGTAKKANVNIETTAAETIKELVINKDLQTPGWEKRADGSLYYIKKDGTAAEGTMALGKQFLTFSENGALAMIDRNPAVSDDPSIIYDEDAAYEVKNGDIYKIDLTGIGEDISITKNGHVVQADIRCGYLWYICNYQVPNSDQVKTTIYRAEVSGENQEEVYTTDNILKSEQFQITEDFMYYISGGMLLRRNLKSEKVELMAEQVEHYFAWQDTAYYMKDRALQTVSQGVDYSGVEAGYKIELRDGGFVLLDAIGETVNPDANGEKQIGDRIYKIENGIITSTRPAVRKSEGTVYYISEAGTDRKIYSKKESGTQNLIRQEGITVDSFCIAGEWLYYSARTGVFGGEPGSQIYRLNLQTQEQEAVGEGFSGYMQNMYYFESNQKIYGEYIPATADPEKIRGTIGVITIGNNPETLNDSGAIPDSQGSYALELVMADEEKLYCLYHTVTYDGATETMTYTSSQPIVIDIK